MKILIVFNHPASYKVKQFNALAKIADLTVLFERESAIDRPKSFYDEDIHFKHYLFHDGYYSTEYSKTSKIRKFIKEHHAEYDYIIMNGYSGVAERKAIRYLNRHNIPFTLMINGGVIHNKESLFKKWYKTRYISSANKYLSPSIYADKYLLYYGAKENKIYHYGYSSIESKDILSKPLTKKEKVELRNKYHLPISSRIFIAPNQFIERKNNMQLIEYFKNREDILLLIGQGNEKEKYLKYISENNLKNIFVIDHVDKKTLFEYYQLSDVVVSFSKEDIFGHTIIEGMANALPAIAANNILSAHTAIKNGINGFIIDLNDINSINYAFNNIDRCDINACLKSAKENSIDMTAQQIIEALKQ